jgi:hypothetical protein
MLPSAVARASLAGPCALGQEIGAATAWISREEA